MLSTAALEDPSILLAGDLFVYRDRSGPEKGRPRLSVSVWCGFCRRQHSISWPDEAREDTALGPVELPCRGSLWGDRRIHVGLNPDRHAENKRISEEFRAALRRWTIQKNLERRWMEARVAARAYCRDYPDGLDPHVPTGHLASWDPSGDRLPFLPI
jgi:hypothetical protein